MNSNRISIVLAVALAFCLGWMVRDLGRREPAAPMSANAGDLIPIGTPSAKTGALYMTVSQDGDHITAWRFDQGGETGFPKLMESKAYEAKR